MSAPGSQRSGLQGDMDCNEQAVDSMLDNDPDSSVQGQQEANRETEQEVEQGVARIIGKEIAKAVAREIVISREIGREIGKEIASVIAGEIRREATQEVAPREVTPQEDTPQEIAPQQVLQDTQQPVNQLANQQIQLLSATMTRTSLRSSWRLQLTFPAGSESSMDEFCTEFNRSLSHMLKRKAYMLDPPDPPDPALGCRVILPVHGLVQVAPVPVPTLHFGSKRAAKSFKKHAFVFEHPLEDAESQKSLYMPTMSIDAFQEKLSSRGSRVWSWWPHLDSHLHSGAF